MWTDAKLPKTASPHTNKCFLDARDCVAFTKCRNVIDENMAAFTTDQFIRDAPVYRCFINWDFVAAIQKDTDIINDRISGLRFGPKALFVLQNLETRGKFQGGTNEQLF